MNNEAKAKLDVGQFIIKSGKGLMFLVGAVIGIFLFPFLLVVAFTLLDKMGIVGQLLILLYMISPMAMVIVLYLQVQSIKKMKARIKELQMESDELKHHLSQERRKRR